MPFQIIRNDITKVKADAIVNTANPYPEIGDGVDRAIYEAAGKEKLLKERLTIGEIPEGEVAITKAYHLKAKYIIHASGPWYQGGNQSEAEKLKSCYEKSLRLAARYGCESIAFPLISTGTYGFVRDEALHIAISVFRNFLMEYDIQILLVVFDPVSVRITENMLSGLTHYIDENYVDQMLMREYQAQLPKALKKDDDVIESEDSGFETNALQRFQLREECRENRVQEAPRQRNKEKPIIERQVRTKRSSLVDTYSNRMASVPSMDKPKHSLDQYMNESALTLVEYLQQLINKKGMANAEVYKRANLDKKYFSKLMTGKVNPTKTKLLSIAIALRLNLDETKDFLTYAGYALAPNNKTDLVFQYYIQMGEYDIFTIDIALFEFGLPTLTE